MDPFCNLMEWAVGCSFGPVELKIEISTRGTAVTKSAKCEVRTFPLDLLPKNCDNCALPSLPFHYNCCNYRTSSPPRTHDGVRTSPLGRPAVRMRTHTSHPRRSVCASRHGVQLPLPVFPEAPCHFALAALVIHRQRTGATSKARMRICGTSAHAQSPLRSEDHHSREVCGCVESVALAGLLAGCAQR